MVLRLLLDENYFLSFNVSCKVHSYIFASLIFTFDIYDQKQYIDFIRPNLQIFIENELISGSHISFHDKRVMEKLGK